MENANDKGTQKWDRYSDGKWSELRRRAEEARAEYERSGHGEAAKHRLVDALRELSGGVKAASDLIPKIMAEHRRGVEWGLERLLVSARRLEDLPHVESGERQAVEQRVRGVITLIDLGELDGAEAAVRDIEAHVECLQQASLEAEFNALLAGIGEMYQPAV